jgi:predicted SAM-dependent methyltransferase
MNVLEKDVVMGTFTHRETYLSELLRSVKNYFPGVHFIVQLADQGIKNNMYDLRKKFMDTKKRFWVFLDDDVIFLNKDTLSIAVSTLIRGNYGAVGLYLTYDMCIDLNSLNLETKEANWIPCYFMMVDSKLVGDVEPDLNLPIEMCIDTSYCCEITKRGYKIAYAPSIIYHPYKYPIYGEKEDIVVHKYLFEKWGNYYSEQVRRLLQVRGNIPSSDMSMNDVYVDRRLLNENKRRLMEWSCSMENKTSLDMSTVDDMLHLPYESETFDHITCHNVLKYLTLTDMEIALRECHRVLKRNGTMDIRTPDIDLSCANYIYYASKSLRNKALTAIYGDSKTHKSGISKDDLNEKLKSMDFEIIESYNYDDEGIPNIFSLIRRI